MSNFFQINTIFRATAIASAVMLSACGGGDGAENTNTPTPQHTVSIQTSGLSGGSYNIRLPNSQTLTISNNDTQQIATVSQGGSFQFDFIGQPNKQHCLTSSNTNNIQNNIVIQVDCRDLASTVSINTEPGEIKTLNLPKAYANQTIQAQTSTGQPVAATVDNNTLSLVLPPLPEGQHTIVFGIDGEKYAQNITITAPNPKNNPTEIINKFIDGLKQESNRLKNLGDSDSLIMAAELEKMSADANAELAKRSPAEIRFAANFIKSINDQAISQSLAVPSNLNKAFSGLKNVQITLPSACKAQLTTLANGLSATITGGYLLGATVPTALAMPWLPFVTVPLGLTSVIIGLDLTKQAYNNLIGTACYDQESVKEIDDSDVSLDPLSLNMRAQQLTAQSTTYNITKSFTNNQEHSISLKGKLMPPASITNAVQPIKVTINKLLTITDLQILKKAAAQIDLLTQPRSVPLDLTGFTASTPWGVGGNNNAVIITAQNNSSPSIKITPSIQNLTSEASFVMRLSKGERSFDFNAKVTKPEMVCTTAWTPEGAPPSSHKNCQILIGGIYYPIGKQISYCSGFDRAPAGQSWVKTEEYFVMGGDRDKTVLDGERKGFECNATSQNKIQGKTIYQNGAPIHAYDYIAGTLYREYEVKNNLVHGYEKLYNLDWNGQLDSVSEWDAGRILTTISYHRNGKLSGYIKWHYSTPQSTNAEIEIQEKYCPGGTLEYRWVKGGGNPTGLGWCPLGA